MRDMPYFMDDESWYEFDFYKRIWVLTNKAPQEAKNSYNDYLKEIESNNKKRGENNV